MGERRDERQDNRSDRRDDMSEQRDERQENRSDRRDEFRENHPDARRNLIKRDAIRDARYRRWDYWDDRLDRYEDRWYYWRRYYPPSVYLAMPCTRTVVVVGNVTYYRCDSLWYNQVYYEGAVSYVEISAPAGAEVEKLPYSYTLEADGQTYYVSDNTFYQRIARDGKQLYVVVDPPYGAEVASISEDALEVTVEDKTYYQYDKVFYRKIGDGEDTTYVIVASPFKDS
jgi:hypothetical protein